MPIFPLIIFFIILSFLVLIHEFGHYIAAKKSGVGVEEFGFGIPPRIYGKKIGETIYSINILPFGGFVRVRGEDVGEKVDPNDKKNFANKTPLIRGIILSAGVIMNIALGVILYTVVLASRNFQSPPILMFNDFHFPFGQTVSMDTVITYVNPSSPASRAGLKFGDYIQEVEFEGKKYEIRSVSDIRKAINDKQGQTVKVTVLNVSTDIKRVVEVTPVYNEDYQRVVMGVGLGTVAELKYASPVEKVFSGFLHGVNVISYSLTTMKDLIAVSIRQKNVEPVATGFSGPVGMFSVVKDILSEGGSSAVFSLLDLSALISFSLAFFNLLPIPALDGGRLVFVLFEAVTRKKPNPRFEASVHKAGIIALLALMLLVTIKDIIQL